MYYLENGQLILQQVSHPNWAEETMVDVLSKAEALESMEEMHQHLLRKAFQSDAIRLEIYKDADLFCLKPFKLKHPAVPADPFYLLVQKKRLYIICDDSEVGGTLLKHIQKETVPKTCLGQLICLIIEHITERDMEYLEHFENRLATLEDDIILNRKQGQNYVQIIIAMRKRLLILKRYYEQLLNIFDGVEENDNQLFDKQALRFFKISRGRIARLYHNVLSQCDYIAQIREAYQSEVDINLNTTMKIFTVVTTVFFPLTLIAGWYGMNLQMPEYASPASYPIVIGISILVVAVTLVVFKRRKWF